MKNKIVLFSSDIRYGGSPLALLSITKLLDINKYDIRIITHIEYPDYENEILKCCEGALCLGISCLTGKPAKVALQVSKLVKKKYPSLPIIWGGWQAITLSEVTLSSPYIDYLCTGQGERTFYEFIKMIESNDYGNISNISGLSYKLKGEIIHNLKKEPEDLDNFPEFNLSLIDWKKYLEVTDYGVKALRIITSYGCPYHCGFCCENYSSNRRWKALSAARIINFLKNLRSKVNFDSLIIGDSNFFVNEKRVVDFCNGLVDNEFNIKYGSVNGTANILIKYKEATWRLLQRTGLYNILLGVESADNQTLKVIGKAATVEHTYRLSQLCKEYGIKLIASTIIGIPTESYFRENKQKAFDDEIRGLFRLYKDLNRVDQNNFFVTFFYSPLPATPLYNKAIELGFVPPKNLEEWANHDLLSIHFPWVTKSMTKKIMMLNYISFIISKDIKNFMVSIPMVFRLFAAPTFTIAKLVCRLRLKFNYLGFPIDHDLYQIGLKLFYRINRYLNIINIIDNS